MDGQGVCSRNKVQVPSVSGFTALIMPTNLPAFLMPSGSSTMNWKSVGHTQERITILGVLEGTVLEHWKSNGE